MKHLNCHILFFVLFSKEMLKWCTKFMYCNTQPSVISLYVLTHSHTSTHTHFFLFWWMVEYRLEVLLIGCKATVASSIYTSLEGRQHQPHIISMAPSFGICQWGKCILKHTHTHIDTYRHTVTQVELYTHERKQKHTYSKNINVHK